MKLLLIIACGVLVFITHTIQAQPYIPQADADIIETLPTRSAAWFTTKSLRQQLNAEPNNLKLALSLVKHYIELGRADADPRYFGYAEAVLAPWLASPRPAPEALTLRATLYQNRHEFPAALRYLDQALALQPRLAQAWLTKALVLEVQGQYAAALKSCLPLLKLASPLAATMCINTSQSLSGQLDAAYRQLRQIVTHLNNEPPEDQQWALVTLAEMAERIGDNTAADHYYQAALAVNLRNAYLLGSYADFLQDQGRYQTVITLLANETRADGLLLRLTLAEQQAPTAALATHIDWLKARFAASRMRGDVTHQGDEARFTLHVLHQSEQALALAQKNWAVQREPRDARILLEATLATDTQKQAALPTLAFLAENHVQDVRLQVLITRLKASGAVASN